MRESLPPQLPTAEQKYLERYEEPSELPPLSSGYEIQGDEGDGGGLREHLYSVRRYLWLIMLLTALSAAFAAVYMARKPDVYEAQAQVQIDLENNPARDLMKNGSIVLNSPVNDPDYFNTQLRILTSTALLGRVAKTLDLQHNVNFLRPEAVRNRSTWRNLQRMVGLGGSAAGKENADESLLLNSSVAPPTSRDDLAELKRLAPYVNALRASLKVEPEENTRLINISYVHPDPQMAAKVVNAIADTLVISNLERMTETNSSAGDFLQKRIADLQAQIRNGEERLINYAKNHQILSLDAGQNMVVDRLSGLNRQLLEAENERKLAEAAYRAATAPGAANVLSESGNAALANADGTLAALKQRRAQALVENTEEWPEVKEINRQIEVLEKQNSEIRDRSASLLTSNLEIRYRQALGREQSLRDAFEQQRRETITQNEAAINYRIIQQEIQTNKTLLDGLLQRFKENDLLLAKTPNNIHVADYAMAPEKSAGPKRAQMVATVSGLTLAFSVGLALLLGFVDDAMRSSDEVERRLGLPTLAVVPAVGSAARLRLLPSVNGRRNGHHHWRPVMVGGKPPELVETYRKLRTSVLLSSPGSAPKTLLVTSTLPSEGKTTTAINMAITLAQTGARVLLIDGDMRNPNLHKEFNLENERGLSTALATDITEAEIMSLITPLETEGVFVLPAGPSTARPPELLGSDAMRRLLESFEMSFTHIVIDSPPVAAFTDSVLLSVRVDGVLLVVHGGKSSAKAVQRARKVLKDVGANIYGVVLNNVNRHEHDDYYYYKAGS